MFTIQRIVARSNSTIQGPNWSVEVSVHVDAKSWSKLKAKRQLGMLYGVDISNAVYAINRNIPATCPTVDDHARASKGIKRIELVYFLNDPAHAEALGLKVMRLKNGECYGKLYDIVNIVIPTLRGV